MDEGNPNQKATPEEMLPGGQSLSLDTDRQLADTEMINGAVESPTDSEDSVLPKQELSIDRQHEIMHEAIARLGREVAPVLEDFQQQIIAISDELQARLVSGGKVTDEDIEKLKAVLNNLHYYITSTATQRALIDSITDPLMQLPARIAFHNIQHFHDPLENYIEQIESYKKGYEKRLKYPGYPKQEIPIGYQPIDLEHYTFGYGDKELISVTPRDLNEDIENLAYEYRKRLEQANVATSVELPQTETIVGYVRNIGTDILHDLVRNSLAAMPKGGQLDFKLLHHGEEAVLTISDNGVGIPEEILDKVLEEGFTTKPNGTGMGLALARRYFEDVLGGKFSIESEVGKGTTITIKLPMVEQSTKDEKED